MNSDNSDIEIFNYDYQARSTPCKSMKLKSCNIRMGLLVKTQVWDQDYHYRGVSHKLKLHQFTPHALQWNILNSSIHFLSSYRFQKWAEYRFLYTCSQNYF